MGWWEGRPWPTGASWTGNKDAAIIGISRASSLQEHARLLHCPMEKRKRSEEEKERALHHQEAIEGGKQIKGGSIEVRD